MNRVRTRLDRDIEDLAHGEVALLRRRWSDQVRLVRFEREWKRHIRFGAYGDRVDPQAPRRTDDAARDLATVCNEELLQRAHFSASPKIARVSATVAGSRPTSRAMRAALA